MQDTSSNPDLNAPCTTSWHGWRNHCSPPSAARFSSCGRLWGRRLSRRGGDQRGNLDQAAMASAVPSFARQTGQPCATCHTAFPELTPFGRRFKLGGYTMGGGLTFEEAPPIAAMLAPTFTHTARNQDTPPAPGTSTNNNTVLQQASVFYGGTIYGNLGAFIQMTYDRATVTYVSRQYRCPLRGHDEISRLGSALRVSVNNNPTVQDVWNTTPAWGFPYIASSLAPQFSPPGTLIEGALAGKVVGTRGLHVLERHALH